MIEKCESNTAHIKEVSELITSVKERYESDYAEFIKDRKRWKASFDLASGKATS